MKQFNLEEIMKNGGRCQTRDGRAARIICTDRANSSHPLIVLIGTEGDGDNVESVWPYTVSGHNHRFEGDLVPLPKRIQREYWANGYATGQFGFYSSREGADLNAGARVACVKVVIDCEEGEGLEEAT